MKKNILFLALLFLLQIKNSFAAQSNWQEQESKGAKTKVIASFYEDESKTKKLILGVHFKIEDGWKIYGNDNSGIGMPPSFDFSKSENISAHQISWPEAHLEEEKIGDETFKFLTYKKEVIIPIEVDLKEGSENKISFNLDYGLCKDICVPASASFELEIPDEIDEESLAQIQKFFPKKISTKTVIEPTSDEAPNTALITMIIIALIGGAILNIMPCVLPVLSIKLISVINHSNTPLRKIRFAFISTVIGILSCFILFAGAASLIKITGNSLGWGLQFQNPYFLISLILILTFFTANMLGFFEITFEQFLANLLNRKINEGEKKKNIFLPNFFSGVLAVLLATPCSAPFLGTAISFALSQSFAIIITIFLAIGLGFSLPYLILLITPKMVYLLPKPGKWMLKIKQLMALFLVATVLWLIYVLSNNISYLSAILVTVLAVLVIPALKLKSYFLKSLALISIISLSIISPNFFKKNLDEKNESEMVWREFDESQIQEQIEMGHVVVIDITADWCLTCKFNKIRVLKDEEVVAKLKSGLIVAMRGDITKPNPQILEFLHKHNRFAIPFNAVYGPNAKEGLLTNELLTKKELFQLIEKAK